MDEIFFGLAEQYDQGSIPQISINAKGTVLEVHKNEEGFSLYYRVGTLNKATVEWGASHHYDDGNSPACAINRNNVAVEVHKNQLGSTLYYHVGTVSGKSVEWSKSREYDSGIQPNVAMNDDGIVVEVHKTQSPFSNGLYYHVGQVKDDKIDWHSSNKYDSGALPQVAIDNNGNVVEVHQSESKSEVWYHVGRITGSKIDFGGSVEFGSGTAPSVALAENGVVITTWTRNDSTLMQRTGRLEGGKIAWQGDAVEFDDGEYSSSAVANDTAIQVHPSETIKYGLWYSTSLLTSRSSWMQNRLNTLGQRPLSELTLPASHDSGMYKDGIAILGKTQDLSIYGQLNAGIRYFDLRPKWTGSKFIIYHGPIDGPDLSEVLDDIQKFCREGHRELAILKLSHFDNIDGNTYSKLLDQIENVIGIWLVQNIPGGKRLADVTLNEYVNKGPAMLMAVDGSLPVEHPRQGFWVYRDWDSGQPEQGQLNVYDKYSDTTDFDKMKKDQSHKFESFDGRCKNDPSVPCDLFLLSWTLTPVTGVWYVSKPANRSLGQAMVALPLTNQYGKRINMLYVDYVEYARVTDVAIIQNETSNATVGEMR